MKTFSGLENQVVQWAESCGIIPHATTASQLIGLLRAEGMLLSAESRHDLPTIKEAVGDILICLINYCALHDIAMVECLRTSFQQVKGDKTTLFSDGTFVKELT